MVCSKAFVWCRWARWSSQFRPFRLLRGKQRPDNFNCVNLSSDKCLWNLRSFESTWTHRTLRARQESQPMSRRGVGEVKLGSGRRARAIIGIWTGVTHSAASACTLVSPLSFHHLLRCLEVLGPCRRSRWVCRRRLSWTTRPRCSTWGWPLDP